MADSQKQKERFIVLSGDGKRQAVKHTASADEVFDTRHNCTFTITDVVQSETVYDCGGQDIHNEETESQMKKLVVTYAIVTPQIIALWLAYFLSAAAAPVTAGSQKKHVLTRSADDSLAGFGFIEGFEDDTTPAQKYKDFKVDSLAFTLNRRKNVGLTVTAYGHFETEDVGEDWELPECQNLPALKGRHCEVLINAVEKTSLLWQAGINLNNSIPTGDDVFPFDSVNIDEFERGEKPTYPLTAQIEGSKGNTLYTNAQSRAKQAVVFQLGETGSDNVVLTFPQTMLKLADPSTVFIGELNKSAINLEMTPHKDGTLKAPLKAEFFGSQTTSFLAVPA